ncbi:MAG TPA: hypothetical protein DCE56_35020 [Cyanobacteria bacterium UBA8553]|nr:hypothetical protein [Cyanobacteria bacterium UBA8553]
MGTLKFLLRARFERSTKKAHKVSGFTLLELLVGLILAFLIITPLLGFMINIMNTDRQEQAKVNTEQDLQAAMDYISRDLQQAVYIYDQYALDNPNTSDPETSGIQGQLPSGAQGVPVLVFWKRNLVPKALPAGAATSCPSSPRNPNCNDAFVYSLVAYYLISTPGSATAKIGRFEIQDGVRDPTSRTNTYLPGYPADAGFQPFTVLSSGTITQSMNQWRKRGEPDPAKLPQNNILVEYIDNSPTTAAGNPIPVEACPADSDATDNDLEWTQIPSTTPTYSFYSCVWSSKNTARVFIRGNALARIRNTNNNYAPSLSAFFPRTRIEVKSRASLGTNSGS